MKREIEFICEKCWSSNVNVINANIIGQKQH